MQYASQFQVEKLEKAPVGTFAVYCEYWFPSLSKLDNSTHVAARQRDGHGGRGPAAGDLVLRAAPGLGQLGRAHGRGHRRPPADAAQRQEARQILHADPLVDI